MTRRPTLDARQALSQGLTDTLNAESDRAAAVLGVSVLDAQLEDLFRASLIPFAPKDEYERLYTGGGPLSTFSGRIDLAFSYGWISAKARRDLHILRGIRNHFAHSFDHTITFEDESTRSKVLALQIVPDDAGWFRQIRAEALANENQKVVTSLDEAIAYSDKAKSRFLTAVSMYMLQFTLRRSQAERPPERDWEWGPRQRFDVTLKEGEEVSLFPPPSTGAS